MATRVPALIQLSDPRVAAQLVYILDMHPLADASRSRLLEMEPKLFVFETMRSVDDIALNLSLRKSKREYS